LIDITTHIMSIINRKKSYNDEKKKGDYIEIISI